MNREFVELEIFEKRWKELGLTDDDLCVLQDTLKRNPKAGDMMQGTGGIYKIRIPLENKGKSGGARVFYTDFEQYEIIYLITAFAKDKQANLTSAEKNALRKLVKSLLLALREGSD